MKNPIAAIDDFAKNSFKVIPFVSLIAPAMIIMCGIAVSLAIIQVQRAFQLGSQTAAVVMQKTAKPRLEQVKLPPPGYIEAATVLARLNPGVTVSYKKETDSLHVAVAAPDQLPEWLYLLSTVQGYRKGLVWSASEICLKKCEGGAAAVAELHAVTQKISVDSPQ
jgi:hypothetical protein